MADHDMESRLRDLLGAHDAGGHTLDSEEIVRRAKRRRRSRQLALGTGSTLAAAGVLVLGISALPQLGGDHNAAMIATDSRGESDGLAESTQPVSPYSTPVCEELAGVSAARVELAVGNELTASAESVSGSVTLTNTSDETVSGSVVSVRVSFTDDEHILWQAAVQESRAFALEPGATETISITQSPSACGSSPAAGDPADWVRVDVELPTGPVVLIEELE